MCYHGLTQEIPCQNLCIDVMIMIIHIPHAHTIGVHGYMHTRNTCIAHNTHACMHAWIHATHVIHMHTYNTHAHTNTHIYNTWRDADYIILTLFVEL